MLAFSTISGNIFRFWFLFWFLNWLLHMSWYDFRFCWFRLHSFNIFFFFFGCMYMNNFNRLGFFLDFCWFGDFYSSFFDGFCFWRGCDRWFWNRCKSLFLGGLLSFDRLKRSVGLLKSVSSEGLVCHKLGNLIDKCSIFHIAFYCFAEPISPLSKSLSWFDVFEDSGHNLRLSFIESVGCIGVRIDWDEVWKNK